MNIETHYAKSSKPNMGRKMVHYLVYMWILIKKIKDENIVSDKALTNLTYARLGFTLQLYKKIEYIEIYKNKNRTVVTRGSEESRLEGECVNKGE